MLLGRPPAPPIPPRRAPPPSLLDWNQPPLTTRARPAGEALLGLPDLVVYGLAIPDKAYLGLLVAVVLLGWRGLLVAVILFLAYLSQRNMQDAEEQMRAAQMRQEAAARAPSGGDEGGGLGGLVGGYFSRPGGARGGGGQGPTPNPAPQPSGPGGGTSSSWQGRGSGHRLGSS